MKFERIAPNKIKLPYPQEDLKHGTKLRKPCLQFPGSTNMFGV